MKETTKAPNHLINCLNQMKRITLSIIFFYAITAMNAQAGSEKFIDSAMVQGKIKYNNGRYEEAIKDFSIIIEADAKNIHAYLQRGFSYVLLKDFTHAIEDFSTVIQLEPEHEWAYISRGGAYNKLLEYNKAIDDFNAALALMPNDSEASEAYNNRGFSKKMLGDKVGACEDWHKSKKLGNDEAYIIIKNNRCK